MNIIVVGGDGFIGSHLVKELEKDNEVLAINYDSVLLRDSLHFNNVDVVYNMVGLASTRQCIEQPLICHDLNCSVALNVLQVCRIWHVPRVVMCSSAIVNAPYSPAWASKNAMELYVQTYIHQYDMSVLALRFSNVFGEENKNGIHHIFEEQKKNKGYLEVSGDGTQTRDYLPVEAAVRALILAGKSDYKGFLDICTGKQTSLNEIAKEYRVPIHYVQTQKGEPEVMWQSPKEAKEILGFEA